MVSRRYLRTKVMQAIYAFDCNDNKDIVTAEKKLINSIQAFYTLFFYLFSLLPEIKRYRFNKMENLKEKFNPTEEDLHPNTKFVENLLITQIENSPSLNKSLNAMHINWSNDNDFLATMYQEIAKSEYYEQYMANPARSYEEDKKFVLYVIEEIFAKSEMLHWFMEEKNVHWFDDYNDALLMVYQNIEYLKEKQGKSIKIFPLLKNEEEDTIFYRTLFNSTLLNNDKYEQAIERNLKNWEVERVMGIDMILMKMAICEFLEFNEIPIKVTINEYIELAKTYSSVKSGIFINGLLDKIVTDLKNQGQLNKMGRGLL